VKFRLSRKAEDDIIEVYLAGARDFGVEQAERYHAGLREMFAFLAEHPRAARERTEIVPPVRIHPYKAHVIVYVIEEEDVLFLRVRHGREDWSGQPVGDPG
jgi:toxin ParE1/3/4